MEEDEPVYPEALRLTLRSTAAAYGYTLTIAMTSAVLGSVHGRPHTGALFLFILGGLVAFAGLEILLVSLPHGPEMDDPFPPFAGVLNVFSVSGGLGAATGLAHLVHPQVAWLLAPLAATAVFMVLVAGQVAAVQALRRPRSDAGNGVRGR